jgi:hypothetical protein
MSHEMLEISPTPEEFEMPYEQLHAQVVKQAEILLPTEDEILYHQAINLGFTELQYIRGLRNVQLLTAFQKESVTPDRWIDQELFIQRLSMNLNFKRMQKYIADNNFILGSCDGTFAALTGHSYMHGLHNLIIAANEPRPEGGAPLLAVMSEVGIMENDGTYRRIAPAVFRVLNQEDNGTTLDEAHTIITQHLRGS